MITAIIFDFAGTLFDYGTQDLFPESNGILTYCSKKYTLALCSLAMSESAQRRQERIVQYGFPHYFQIIKVGGDGNKDRLYKEIVQELGIPFSQIVIVDDRTVRGISWGNRHGCTTIWLKKGKFSNELPNKETGQPKYTITELAELKNIL